MWGAVDALGVASFQAIENPSMDVVIDGLNACHGIVANVRGGSHWVLLTGVLLFLWERMPPFLGPPLGFSSHWRLRLLQ